MMAFAESARRVAGWILASALLLAAYWSVRLSRADWLDHQGWRGALQLASALAPDHAGLRAELSDWPGAVARNRYDSASWIRLGLEAEAGGDQISAERYLQRAAEFDRLFDPRWTLANYYFRRQAWMPFWTWARAAAETSPQPPLALYQLCHEATPDMEQIFERVIAGERRLLEGYLYWVQTQDDLVGIRAVASRAIDLAGPEQRGALAACTSRILQLGAPADALRLWNRMLAVRLFPFERLDPGNGVSLTNGDLRQPLRGETFNWVLHGVDGVISRHDGGGVRFEFSGSQAGHCNLLTQNLAVLGGRRYRLRCRYRTSGIERGAGPAWAVAEFATGEPLAAESWSETSMEFVTATRVEVVPLELVYRRMPGTTRINGVLWLENVRLELLGQ